MRQAAVICIQNKRGQILLLHRKHSPYGWCLPGGRVEDMESLSDAVVRELREETGIDVLVTHPQFKGLTQAHNGRDVGIFYYRIEKKNPKVVLSNEHDAYMWIAFPSEWFKEHIEGVTLAGNTLHFLRMGLRIFYSDALREIFK